MVKYHNANVETLNSQLDKFKSTTRNFDKSKSRTNNTERPKSTKYDFGETTKLNDESNFLHKNNMN